MGAVADRGHRGRGHGCDWRCVARSHRGGAEPGLDFKGTNTLDRSPYSFGSHVAVVEVSRENGAIKILQYVAVHDSGKIINPMLADGQVHGAIAQGIGEALLEGMVYNQDGQPLSGSLMDYALPKTIDLPDFELDTMETPSPITALGVKGIGELPTLAAAVAIANAVMNALSGAGVRHINTPLTPQKVWEALQGAPILTFPHRGEGTCSEVP